MRQEKIFQPGYDVVFRLDMFEGDLPFNTGPLRHKQLPDDSLKLTLTSDPTNTSKTRFFWGPSGELLVGVKFDKELELQDEDFKVTSELSIKPVGDKRVIKGTHQTPSTPTTPFIYAENITRNKNYNESRTFA